MSSSVEPVAAAAAEEDQTSNMNANTLIPPLTSPTGKLDLRTEGNTLALLQ